MADEFSIVCVSRQEWSVDLPTNRQQIMLRAARDGHPVLFLETGDHLARHLWRLITRPGRRSLARRLLATERVSDRIRVRKAVNVLPWGQKFSRANRVNAALTRVVARRAADANAVPRVLWLYDPCAFALAGGLDESFAVYDCVDDYAEQVGTDAHRRRFVASADGEAATRAAVVFATTKGLYERQLARNPSTYLVRNGADFDHFSSVTEPARELASLPRPVLGFAGNLTSEKVDFDLLSGLADSHPEWTFALVGPATREARPRAEALAARPNVHWLGHRPYDDLPAYVAAFDVGLIPYRATAYTRNCSPLKVFEYLAAGMPVVAAGLPELVGMEPDVVVADGARAFAVAVERALVAEPAGPERRRELARGNTWDARTERLLGLVKGRLSG